MDVIDGKNARKAGRQVENPLKLLFNDLRLQQQKIEKYAPESRVPITVESMNNLLNMCLEIEKHLAKKPLTIVEIYKWAKNIIQVIPIVTIRDTKEMWKYDKDEGKYVPDAETYIQSLCTNEETGSARASTPDVLRKLIMNIQGDTFKVRIEFEHNADMVNMNNGVYCKSDGKMYPHDHKYFFTYKLQFDYDHKADCPKFKDVVNNLFPNPKHRIVIKRWFGYHFVNGYPYQQYLHLCGPSGAGKSHLLQGLYILLGSGNYTGFSLQDFQDRNSYATASIYKKLGNICADMKTTTIRDMSTIKKLVSTVDTISTRNIYGKTFEFVNGTKMTFVSNKMPIANKNVLSDDAVKRRAMVLKVSKADFEINERLDDIIRSEASGIFNWAMEGYRELINEKSFGYDEDPIKIWIENMEESEDINYLTIPEGYTEKSTEKPDIPKMLEFCIINSPNKEGNIYVSFKEYFTKNGILTDKQENRLVQDYNKLKRIKEMHKDFDKTNETTR